MLFEVAVTDCYSSSVLRALFVATTVLLALEFMRGRGGRSSKNAGGPTFGGNPQV